MRFAPLAAAALALLAAPLAGARAAPQLLGVVATAEPIPMRCEGGRCTIELSSFCLQEERSMPIDGQAYHPLDRDKLSLVVTAADGSVRRLPAAPYVAIASERNYVAVSVSLPESAAKALGAARIAVAVGPDLTLAPEAQPGDAHPMTAAEIAHAQSALRPAADQLFSADSPRFRVAQVMNRLINALPPEADQDPSVGESVWRKVTGTALAAAQPDETLAEAAHIYRYCRSGVSTLWPTGLRHCLAVSHDSAMGGINAEFWQVVGAGS
jgi:hypothetical protein